VKNLYFDKLILICIISASALVAQFSPAPTTPSQPTKITTPAPKPTVVPIIEETPSPDVVRQMTDEEMEQVRGSTATDSEIRLLLIKARQSNWPLNPPPTQNQINRPIQMPASYRHI